ncbi:MAG: AAA family ATPase [Patescibacteria group bacterium]
MKNNKIVLGLAGEIASGKDTVAQYLEKTHRGGTISFSRPLRDILDRLALPQTRENMAWLGTDLRAKFGQDLLAKAITAEVQKSKKRIITLPNVRLESDIKYLKKLPGFHLVRLDADTKIRYQRLLKRGQNPDDKTKTWQQFLKDSKLPTELAIRKVAKKAKYRLDNNGDFKNLYRQIEKLLKTLKLKTKN